MNVKMVFSWSIIQYVTLWGLCVCGCGCVSVSVSVWIIQECWCLSVSECM